MAIRENEWLKGLDNWLRVQPYTFFINLHGDMWQKCGLPDRLIIMRGFVFAVEAKQEGKQPTPLQQWTLSQLQQAGAVVIRGATNKYQVITKITEHIPL